MELKSKGSKKLIIVESPAKAKTINKILGNDFEVKASVGHIKDLPEDKLGVDIQNGFQPEYIIIPGKEKVVKELRQASKNAEKIFIATDPDREGEAIAYHIAEEIKAPEDKIYRAIFHEITPNAVRTAIENPTKIDINKVYSQQARRILDRLVGYNLSPFLWRKVKKGLSAGRVQSVALRMVVEREKEILTFQPQDYWTIHGKFQANPESIFSANLYKYKGKLIVDRSKDEPKFLITDEQKAAEITDELKKLNYALTKVEKKRRKKNPPEPFRTATLQAQASSQLGFSPKQTMMIAQQLYEGIDIEGSTVGLITYMRTDSTRVADDAKKWARTIIEKSFGKEFVGHYKNKEGKKQASVQDAHECIRPTYPDFSPEKVKKYLSKEQFSLYKLIWDRFLASQMSPAEIEQTTYIIEDPESVAQFRVSGSVVVFPGFLILYKEDEAEEETILPALEEKSSVELVDIEAQKHTTEPPSRYTEATLVKALEDKGIGRPSTYAAILGTIQERGYVKKIKQRLYPTYLGFVVSDLLEEKFPELMDYSFTARMEEDLDKISLREAEWQNVVEEFYKEFEKTLSQAKTISKITKPKEIKTPVKCDKCGKEMVIRWNKGVPFLACSGYPECKNTRSLNGKESSKESSEPVSTGKKCPLCGGELVIRKGRKGEFIACTKYPDCKYTQPITADVKCPECGGDVIKRTGKYGRVFWACSNYPKCKFTFPGEPYPYECPKCGAHYMLKKIDKNGEEFLICHNKSCKVKIELNENSVGTDPAQQKDVNPARSGRKQR
ncbi:type I DNA topoisomerase [Thermodesulfovibrio hydrogeniphilus]